MPLLKLETTIALSQEQRTSLLSSLSKVVASAIGKPEQYVMVTRRELRSRSGGLLAWYDKNTDQTFDRHNKRAGFGDQTGKFIPRNER